MERQRFMPCSLVRHRKNGTLHIVKYDYTYAYGGFNSGCKFNNLSLFDLDEKGDIIRCWSWASSKDYELVDETDNRERFRKITEYHQKLYGQKSN